MRKIIIFMLVGLLVIFVGCSKENNVLASNTTENKQSENVSDNTTYSGEIFLNFSFGERKGNYEGDFSNGLPNGYGEFTSTNSEGVKWTYKGEWKDGHFEGKGETKWENGRSQKGLYSNDRIVPLSEDEVALMYSDPETYVGQYVELMGEIFLDPEYYDEGIVIQMYADIENFEDNTIVYIYDKNVELEDGDIIKVYGEVGEVFEGENAFGAKLILPTIHAEGLELITYEQLHPIIAKCDVDEKQIQNGYEVTLEKVEITQEETRVYIRVDNNGKANFNLYSFNAKLVQNGRQYEEETNYDADYPEIQTDLIPGVYTEGIITYPPVEGTQLKLILEASSDDWEEKIEDYIFDVIFK